MAAPFQLLSGRGYTPVAPPRFAVPYDVGQANGYPQLGDLVDRGMPQAEVDRITGEVRNPRAYRPGIDDVGHNLQLLDASPGMGIPVPYDTGHFNQVSRADQSLPPGHPQDEPPAPMIDPQGGSVQDVNPSRGHFIEGPPDIGMGIPVDLHPGGPVTGVNLDTASPVEAAVRALSTLGGGGGGGRSEAAASVQAPRRVVGSRPEFIYTNPVAAKQASENYSARLGAETGQQRGYQDYLARLNESQAFNDRSRQQGALTAQEGAANRASAERIAGTSESVRQQRIADAAWQENERAADLGEQTAAMLNRDPNAKVDRKFVWINPATGKFESRFPRKPRPAAPVQPGQPGMATPVPAAPGVAAPSLAVPEAAPAPSPPAVAVPAQPAPGQSPSMLRRIWDTSIPGMMTSPTGIAGSVINAFR